MGQYKRFSVRQEGTAAVVELLDDEISDLTTLADLSAELSDYIANEKPMRVLLNLNKVTFITSATIEVLLRTKRKVSSEGGQVKLCCLAPFILDVLQRLHLDSIFEIHASEADGLSSFEP
jgi:anti-anti-sigma factor